jgi:hypothetical protein
MRPIIYDIQESGSKVLTATLSELYPQDETRCKCPNPIPSFLGSLKEVVVINYVHTLEWALCLLPDLHRL